ncbi:MAG: alpha-amylase family protein [Paludibacteraceae bacterium]|nr:alpha-amylase family protein [Paludibacteraceae bacterium]MBR0065749.1 alpha-amylase family protein [Paludibacteraceae bacterium]
MNKIIIYQLFPRWFANYNETRKHDGSKEENGCGRFVDINARALKSLSDLGATHVWYTGIIRHATAAHNNPAITKGKAGSPYAITDYYDVDPDLAKDEQKRMQEFEALVQRTHEAGLGVLIDFVPNHVSREYKSTCKPQGVSDLGEGDHPEWAFSPLNNFYYMPGERFTMDMDLQGYEEYPAKVTGNDRFTSHPDKNDWYETVKLNYGVFYQGGGEKQFDPIPNTWTKMLDILLFWADKGIDGVRVDMAEMVPVEFFAWAIARVKKKHKKFIFIGECYDPNRYDAYLEAGFDYLYDKVGMYDYLRGVTSKNWPAEGITHQWMQHGDERIKHMLYFLENHDEQRIASGFFSGSGRCAEPAMIVAATLNQCPVMIYSGQELGERGMDMEGFSGIDGRTSIFDYWGVKSLQAWANKGKFDGGKMNDAQHELRDFYQRLLTLAREDKAIQKGQMYDITYAQGEGFNKHEQFAFLRHVKGETLLVVVNFHDREQQMRVFLPNDAFVYLGMEGKAKATATDLLRGGKQEVSFIPDGVVELKLEAWKGVILKIR